MSTPQKKAAKTRRDKKKLETEIKSLKAQVAKERAIRKAYLSGFKDGKDSK